VRTQEAAATNKEAMRELGGLAEHLSLAFQAADVDGCSEAMSVASGYASEGDKSGEHGCNALKFPTRSADLYLRPGPQPRLGQRGSGSRHR
jgi:hypothetical protein